MVVLLIGKMEGIKLYLFGSVCSLKVNGWWREVGIEVFVMGRINDVFGKVIFVYIMLGKGWVGGGGVWVICLYLWFVLFKVDVWI